MPGDFRCDRGDYARVLFYFAREAAGALGARHSLRPLLLGAAKQFLQNSGVSRREIAEVYLDSTSLRANGSRECAPDDRLREEIHLTAKEDGLLRRFTPRN